jgi:cbb3-type cytochrome oxidase subunit 3
MIRRLLLVLLLALLGYGLWWLFFRSTERQIADAQAAFLATVEDRDWE